MKDWQLTDEEINELYELPVSDLGMDRVIADAAQKKLVEWEHGLCDNIHHKCVYPTFRLLCPGCRRELVEGLKEKEDVQPPPD